MPLARGYAASRRKLSSAWLNHQTVRADWEDNATVGTPSAARGTRALPIPN